MTDAPKRFLLGIAYQAGKDPRIAKGADGGRDYFTDDELEQAAWAFLKSKKFDSGLFHADGTTGHSEIVESFIWRWAPLVIDATPGQEVIVKAGDWLIGTVVDEPTWQMYERGDITGFSPQGRAKRKANK